MDESGANVVVRAVDDIDHYTDPKSYLRVEPGESKNSVVLAWEEDSDTVHQLWYVFE